MIDKTKEERFSHLGTTHLLRLLRAARAAEDVELEEELKREWSKRLARRLGNVWVNAFGTRIID